MAQTKAQLIDGKGDAVVNNKLLVGTSTARATFGSSAAPQFQSEGTTTATGSIAVIKNNASDGGYIFLANTGGSTVGSTTATAGSSELGAVSFNGFDGSNFKEGATIRAVNDQAGAWASGDCPSRLVFSTTVDGASSPTERMRITSGGNVLVGDTALRDLTGQSFQVTGWGMFYQTLNGTTASAFTHIQSGTQTVCLFRQGNPAATAGSITVSGGTSTAFNTSSDYRLKENIASVTDGIARLQQLKPSRFNFIADPDKTVDGFIAHEVQEVVPEAITGEKDAVDDDGNPIYQGIDQSKLVPLLTAALQEAIGEIESLKARVAALESA